MNKTHGFSLGVVSSVMMALFATTIVIVMPTNVMVVSALNSEDLIYVTGFLSPDNTTTGEPQENQT
ncbi:MAG TPA: hypothetical protein VFR94_07250 [Nitrososphaeraceae archaeon]|nr:hypothetical protein [Nitrososphaeraceae archaeon]